MKVKCDRRMSKENKDTKITTSMIYKCTKRTVSFVCTFVYMLLLMLTLGTGTALGQTDFSGIWYIANETNHASATISSHWYLVPGADPHQPHYADAYFHNEYCSKSGKGDYTGDNYGDPEKPFLTTYQTNRDLNSIWIVVSTGDGYYNIIHAKTGKYIVYEPPYQEASNRKSMHLESTTTPGDNAKFAITGSLSGPINIRPQSITTGNRFFNPATGVGNRQYYYGPSGDYWHDGMIGLYSGSNDKSQWYFEDASSATALTPVISDVDGSTNTFTITSPAAAFSSIQYTTDGSTTPDASTGNTVASGSPITITSTWYVQAVGVFSTTFVTPVAGPKELSPLATPPTISYNNATGLVTISSAAALSYYYTTNGDTPTTSTGTLYETPFPVTTATTVKAIAIYAGSVASEPATLDITQVATPTIQKDGSNAITITTNTQGATIYYTTDGSTPTTSSTLYEDPLTENVSNVTIKAIAVMEGMITSAVGSGKVILQCATPVITRDGLTFTLSCSLPTDATLYYTLDGGSEEEYTGTPVSFTSEQLPMTLTAVARHDDYTDSEEASMLLKNGSGTAADPYMIYGATDFANFITNVNSGSTSAAYYKLGTDVSGSSANAITTAFTGTFDGGMHTISNLGHALFNTVNGGVVKNVILDNVSIGSGTNVGAICNEATGASRIYNCGVLATSSTVEKDEDGYDHIASSSSTITGSGYVGSIVGLLDGSSRVINCFSYANVSGGSHVGGIVGYNNVATNANSEDTGHYLKTMVMNCIFYGEVSGTSIAPIYNGEIITNDGDEDGVNNFNYFRLESSYIKNTEITKVYNCALGAETRFLQRFEFFRYLLNSNRELAAWWATGDADNKDEMMKWVMEPTQIGSTTPYPILKNPDKYASVVNYTPSETAYDEANRNKGRKLTSEGDGGVLHVTIQMGSGGAVYPAPSGAGLKPGETGSFDLTITDKDYEHYNFNYGKVQLPYYNDYCDGNYTENRVVTGWKIVSITGGTAGNYSTGDDVTYTDEELTATPYNFADRKCTNKDLYGTNGSNRVFNQGAYWDVPEGVTAITIEPYWGKAVYLADAYWDVVYKNGTGGTGTGAGKNYDAMTTAVNVTTVGGQRVSTFKDQPIITSISDAISSSNDNGLFKGVTGTPANQTVYDYAVVLVGNYHHTTSPESSNAKPYTVTSVDLDGDNEPDYSLMMRFNGRIAFHPVRYDFLNLIGLGMAQKSTGGIGSYNLGIVQPKFWFEVTNTALFRVTQFEYSRADRVKKPIILQGGVIEQWVSLQQDAGDRVEYFHVGGNVWFKEFHRGSHQDNTNMSTAHPPLSVTGGDFSKFYLTGLYQSQAKIYDDNAECYINGGRFGEMAGAGMEGIGTSDGKGNITWVIDNADIKEFYGGGINHAKPVHGNIHTIISNSHVNVFCGGPKFGDMASGRTVTTTATNCTFDTYFGAGYGGNSYFRYAPRNHNNIINFPHNDTGSPSAGNHASWNKWLEAYYNQDYNSTYYGVSTQFDYQFLPMSSNTDNVARIFVEYVGFSLATCRNVTSSLTGCTVTGNFYGGGSLGKVAGDVTSTLTDCTVIGNVFGAGYSASIPTVEVMDIGFETEPYYYEDLGTYRTGVLPTKTTTTYKTTTYTWEHRDQVTKTEEAIDKNAHILYTTEDLTQLGTVIGKVTLTIDGTTTVGESVFGGGESSNVGDVDSSDESSTTVNVIGGTVTHDVYGGGALANVDGNTKVNLIGGTVARDVYGGGKGRLEVAGKEAVGTEGEEGYEPAVERVTAIAAKVGSATVNLNGIDATDYKAAYTTLTREGDSGPYTVADDKKGCVVGGDIFGCNNLNGTPLGDVTVHVYATQNAAATRITNTTEDETAKVFGRYDVQHVYGGGNLAAYEPTSNTHTTVIIDGCYRTSIYQVYGGGNAASTPATEVNINGTFEIEEAFGGGNGKDAITINGVTKPNPGANVGFKDYSSVESTYPTKDSRQTEAFISAYTYGTGEAKMNIHGGKVHRVYGGSNTKGNVRISAVTMLEEESDCPFDVDEAYGGGKSAPMDGASNLIMACIPGLKAAYGGAEDANIEGDVSLNITNGYFDRVFGGNNVSGSIKGTITVNIEETGCKPIVIGQLYGGGNLAPYSAPSGEHGPTLNVRSFTSIGEVYGGGYGETAIVTGDPYVNINVCDGMDYRNNASLVSTVAEEIANRATITFTEYVIENGQLKLDDDGNRIPVEKTVSLNMPTRTGLVGAINKVFGGGNAAKVDGNTYVAIGTSSYEEVVSVIEGVTDVSGFYTRSTTTPYTYTKVPAPTAPATTVPAVAGTTYYMLVVGADITGDVYGGGNAAEVTGDTNVVIGKSN